MSLFSAWLKPAIDSGVRKGVNQAVDEYFKSGKLDKMILSIAMENPRWVFIKQIQNRLWKQDPSMTDQQSFELAKELLGNFLRDERIEFGDPRFNWSKDAAVALAEEEIDHWDQQP